ncbi:DNA-methyltransferase [Candidatus Lucifugimonas marina]|uniref:Site-specific DNA-methyltransferase n=1 Tax=Candidatus Lucifugimonas marina TaxID=3038979 RepID=A0AAJ6CU98_9CHLR|nr:site-specific DNA-methyltransferase [SAR202 cluster bacterium JH702]MDG0869871.1 site-specific DNA-methyltransferase [SAR202 cluster bacterium JH639]WFG34597.1 site-specific DNA-methyltransferase [SAR202 cluster bacterium JH545]WFG38525.1 site-specific DNA-methyltransferase [SAR202 cluster bacterium JH1073]
MSSNSIHLADNLEFLSGVDNASVNLIYIDPPFNTGVKQSMTSLKTVRDDQGDRTGFGGNRYRTERGDSKSYLDSFDDYMGFLAPRMEEARRVLADDGSLFLHVDQRESHYCKVLLDQIFGRDSFMNEIIWAYDYGGRSKRKWPAKHDTIFWYSVDPKNYTFNAEAIDRIPYMAPSLVGKEKAARGKVPTDVWWQTIVPTNGKERTGYPTQKPLAILERIVKVHSNPGELVLDFFAGSGTTGVAAAKNDRQFVLADANPEAVQVQAKRLAEYEPECVGFTPDALII